MAKKSDFMTQATRSVMRFQQVHDQSGAPAMHMARGMAARDILTNFAVSELLVGSSKGILKYDVEGLKPELFALIGTGQEDGTLPIKRLALAQDVLPLLEQVASLPKKELLHALSKIPTPFSGFWLEMPQIGTGHLRYAHWCRVSGEGEARIIEANSYHFYTSPTPIPDGTIGVGMKEPELITISAGHMNDGAHLEQSYIDELGEDAFTRFVDLTDKYMRELVAAMIILGSRRFNTGAFAPETPEERAERVREFRLNRARLRNGKKPLLPLRPIHIEIGQRLAKAIAENRLKEIKQLLGITAVMAHPMRVHRADGTIGTVTRREHDRHFPADEPVDRRDVKREISLNLKGGASLTLNSPGLPGLPRPLAGPLSLPVLKK